MYIHIMKREMLKNHILYTTKTLLGTICRVVVNKFTSDSHSPKTMTFVSLLSTYASKRRVVKYCVQYLASTAYSTVRLTMAQFAN